MGRQSVEPRWWPYLTEAAGSPAVNIKFGHAWRFSPGIPGPISSPSLALRFRPWDVKARRVVRFAQADTLSQQASLFSVSDH
jgi:hypothetical protein